MQRCAKCGEEIVDPKEQLAYEITGWEVPRGMGGANQIHMRERTQSIVHLRPCFERMKREWKGQGGDTLF